MSFFLLERVLTPDDLCVFHSLKFGICDSWYICSSMCTCLLTFNLSMFASLCNKSDPVILSLPKAQRRALFCKVCNFFLTFLVAECRKISPYSRMGSIMFLYMRSAALLVIKDLILVS